MLQCSGIDSSLTEPFAVVKQAIARNGTELRRLALCLLLSGIGSAAAFGQEAEQTTGVTGQTASTQTSAPSADDKERVATAAVFLLVLVVMVGVALLLAVVLWGRSVRRVARKPTPRISPGDELWYLKPDKTTEAKQPATDSENHDPPEPEAD